MLSFPWFWCHGVVMRRVVLYRVFEVLFCVVLCYGVYCKKSDWWVPLGLGNELCTPPVTSPTIIHKIHQTHRNTKIHRNTKDTKMMQGLVTKANKEQEQITLLKQRKDAKIAYERMKKKYIPSQTNSSALCHLCADEYL